MSADLARRVEQAARGGRDFHRFLHHRLRSPAAVTADNAGRPTVAPDLLGEAVVLIDVLRQLFRLEVAADPTTREAWQAAIGPAGTDRPFVFHCAAVALALETSGRGALIRRARTPSDDQLVARLNRAVTGSGAPRLRRTAREEMHWHKALAVQWFGGTLDTPCDLCAPADLPAQSVTSQPGAWR